MRLLTPDRNERMSLGRRRAIKSLGGVALVGLTRKSFALIPLGGSASSGGSDPTTLPRLQSSAISYLGAFAVPSTINSTDFSVVGTICGIDHNTHSGAYPDGVIYLTKNQTFNVAAVAIPTRAQIAAWQTSVKLATPVYGVVTFPNSAGTGGATYWQTGGIVYNGKLIYQQADTYGNGGQQYTHGQASLDLTSITAMLPSNPAYGMRHVNWYSGNIPAQWQTLFGGPCLTGAGVESTLQDCALGPSAYVYDPAAVIAGTNPVPMTQILDYEYVNATDYSRAIGGNTPQVGWLHNDVVANTTNGSTSLVITGAQGGGAASGIITGAAGTGFKIASGSENVSTTAGIPVGATLLSYLSGGTPGGNGTYQMDMAATATVTGGYCPVGSVDNGYMRQDNRLDGPIFPSNTRTVAFIVTAGTGPLTYKNPNDSNPNGFGSNPYLRRMLMYDANDLLAVKNGTKNPYAPVPYAAFTLNPSPSLLDAYNVFGVCYDDAPLNGNPSRIYLRDDASDGSFNSYVHVFEVTH